MVKFLYINYKVCKFYLLYWIDRWFFLSHDNCIAGRENCIQYVISIVKIQKRFMISSCCDTPVEILTL